MRRVQNILSEIHSQHPATGHPAERPSDVRAQVSTGMYCKFVTN